MRPKPAGRLGSQRRGPPPGHTAPPQLRVGLAGLEPLSWDLQGRFLKLDGEAADNQPDLQVFRDQPGRSVPEERGHRGRVKALARPQRKRSARRKETGVTPYENDRNKGTTVKVPAFVS